MSSSAAAPASGTPDGAPKPLSCANCRQRKIKCDRNPPRCSQCAKSELECVFPSRKRTQRPRRMRHNELLNRISRLEKIVGGADAGAVGAVGRDTFTRMQASAASPSRDTAKTSFIGTAAPGPAAGGPTAHYLSGQFWTNLCDEVEGLKAALDQSSDSDDDESEDDDSPESSGPRDAFGTPNGSFGLLLGNPEHIAGLVTQHPPPDQMFKLLETFMMNVDPLMKIIHRPTVIGAMQAFAVSGQPHAPSPHDDALFFAIYFSALASSPPHLVRELFNQEKPIIVEKYRQGTERALAAADYLNSTEITTLQAFTLYVALLRSHSGSRPSWALISLVIRLAQALNLHRDGDGARFSPFEAEMRRRLWWQVIVLDVRASEDRGTEPIISKDSYNTRLPVNINDEDFGPHTKEPLVDKIGPTDMIYSLCTSMSSGIFGYLGHPQTKPDGTQGTEFPYTEEEIIKQAQRLESLFVHTANPSHYPSSQTAVIVQIVILKLWLSIQYPFAPKPSTGKPRVSRESMLRTAVSIMELNELLNNSPFADRYCWWSETYVQWHPLAVALAELCVQVDGDLVDRAWLIIERVFPKWSRSIADTKRGTLWKPIRKLLKKAKTARAEAQMRTLSLSPSTLSSNEDFRQNVKSEPLSPPPAESAEQLMSSANTVFNEAAMDPSYFFQLPPEIFATEFVGDYNTNVASMDWTPWNEFVTDASANQGEVRPI